MSEEFGDKSRVIVFYSELIKTQTREHELLGYLCCVLAAVD